jgi:hypothetical protein
MNRKENTIFELLQEEFGRLPTHRELCEEIERIEDEFEKWFLSPIIKKDTDNE